MTYSENPNERAELEEEGLVILAVDHSEDNLMILDYLLKSFRCKSVLANTGKQAIMLAKRYLPSLILTEIILEDMSGFDLISHFKRDRSTQNIPIVVVTSLATSEQREKIESAGCDDYISKPYMFQELEDKIRFYLAAQTVVSSEEQHSV